MFNIIRRFKLQDASPFLPDDAAFPTKPFLP